MIYSHFLPAKQNEHTNIMWILNKSLHAEYYFKEGKIVVYRHDSCKCVYDNARTL